MFSNMDKKFKKQLAEKMSSCIAAAFSPFGSKLGVYGAERQLEELGIEIREKDGGFRDMSSILDDVENKIMGDEDMNLKLYTKSGNEYRILLSGFDYDEMLGEVGDAILDGNILEIEEDEITRVIDCKEVEYFAIERIA